MANYKNTVRFLQFFRTAESQSRIFSKEWFFSKLKDYKGLLFQILVAGFIAQLLMLANPLMVQIIIDKVINQRSLDTVSYTHLTLPTSPHV